MNWKRNFVLIFFLLAGIILGALISSLCASIPFLSWLDFGKSVGVSAENPMIIDLSVIKIAFGFEMGINVAQIFTITAALIIYKSVSKKL